MLCCLTISNKIEIAGIVASFVLSVILIWVTISISKKQNKIQKAISERDVKISFMNYRLEFYNELISTVMFLHSDIDVLKSRNDKNYYIDYLDKTREKEKRLMQICNTAKFLFNNDEEIYETAKIIYQNFSDYTAIYADIVLHLDRVSKEYSEYLKSIKVQDFEYKQYLENYEKFNEFLNVKYHKHIECQQTILKIIQENDFDEMFKPYFQTEENSWLREQKKKLKK